MKNVLLFGFLFFCSISLFAQNEINAGILPKINLSSKLSKNIKLVTTLESRQLIVDNRISEYQYVLTDFTNILSHKLSVKNSLNMGYTFRLKEQQGIHRFIQQFNHIQTLGQQRLGHRLGIDQTFGAGEDFTFRSRYRLSFEKGFQGTQIDPREFYFKLSNEYIGAFRKNESELEIRLGSFLGYEINTKNRLEVGIDYRIGDFTKISFSSNFWLGIVYFTSLN
jgi:hypothetical protein